MEEREAIIRLWFDLWPRREDLGINEIFAEDAVYVESWGPQYEGRELVKHWFEEWNIRGKVLARDIKQSFHKENQTLVEWTPDGKIRFLKEFSRNLHRCNPHQDSAAPRFAEEKASWF